jgi:hypothetical protein
MSTDSIPDNSHRLAYGLGLVFHPYLVSVITLFIVLQDLSFQQAAMWVMGLSAILILPLIVLTKYSQRKERYLYQRTSRTPLFIAFEISVLVCIALILAADGPRRLLACFVALLIWMPAQLLVNSLYTKISVHAAVTAACAMGLLLFGTLDTWLLKGMVLLAILATGWARHKTKNHTWQQVVAGWFVGAGAVLVAFPLIL